MSRWLLLLLVGLWQVPSAPRVALRVQPLLAFAPVVWYVSVRIPPHRDNRGLVVAYRLIYDEEWINSGMTLDGERERSVPYRREIHQTRAGEYEMLAELKDGAGAIIAVDRKRLTVLRW